MLKVSNGTTATNGFKISPGTKTNCPHSHKLRVLHLFGSSTSLYYAQLSMAYAQQAVKALANGTADRFEFLFARVHPRGDAAALNGECSSSSSSPTWSFPASMGDADLAKASGGRCGHSEGIGRIAALAIDVAVPHMFCFDGMTTYRSLLDLLDVPFVGCDAATMALSTNKAQTKAVMMAAGTPVPRGEVLRAGERPTLPPPVIIKPCSEDNSMGVALVEFADGLDEALAEAFKFDDEVIVEEYIPLGRELRVGVLAEDKGLKVLPMVDYHLPAERPIRVATDKLTEDDKGVMNGFPTPDTSCPADIEDALMAKLKAGAKSAHVALGCRDYSLYDVRVSPSGDVAFLEACLYCSFAPRSVLVRMAEATGEAALRLVPLFAELVEKAAERKVNVAGGGSMQARGMNVRKAK